MSCCPPPPSKHRIDAADTPAAHAEVLRLNFGVVGGVTAELFSRAEWDNACVEPGEPPVDARLYVALDLSRKDDLHCGRAALRAVRRRRPAAPLLRVEYWMPAQGVERKTELCGVPIDEWGRRGHITACEGSQVRYQEVAARLLELLSEYPDHRACADTKFTRAFCEAAPNAGLEARVIFAKADYQEWRDGEIGSDTLVLEAHSQSGAPHPHSTLGMNESISDIRSAVTDRAIRVEHNPVLSWNVESVELRTGLTGVSFAHSVAKQNKRSADDGFVAATMAVGMWRRDLRRAGREEPGSLDDWLDAVDNPDLLLTL